MKSRNFLLSDLELFYTHATKETWDIEDAHIRALLQTHPDDFFIFYENKELIGYCVALKESDSFGFISSLLVLEQFRSLGYGKKIFTFALKYLGNRQIALDSVLGQESFYEQFGFSSYFDVNTYRFMTGSVTLPKTDYDIINFDVTLSLQGLDRYMQLMLQNSDMDYKAIKTNETITAFAFSFVYKDGYKITLHVDDINEALVLFLTLSNNYDKGTRIYMQSSKLTPMLEALADALHMQEVLKFTRMYNKIL